MLTEYNRVIAEIDLEAVAHNIREIRNITNPKSQIVAVVKGDAYGHGAVEVSKVLLYHGADSLAVAIADEGIQLRQNNIHVPILVLGYTPDSKLEDVVRYDLTSTVFSLEMASALSEAAGRLNKTVDIHIKVDTGMGRIGFLPTEEAKEEICRIYRLPNIRVKGIFTHFSSADEQDKEFANEQIKIFKDFCHGLERKGIHIPICHASNSAGIMDMDIAHLDMVRPGIVLYGLYPSDEVQKQKLLLKPVMSLKTHISFVKKVDIGTPISYGRTFITSQPSIIATVPVGYADGYSRRLSGSGRVLVNGEYAPIVGRVCMDQFMIDVTQVPNVQTGDEVVLIGTQGNKQITAEEIAKAIGTIQYEVVCMIGKRIPRVYIKNHSILKTVNYL